MSLTKKQVIESIIAAHENEKLKSIECAENFKNSKTFPDVSEIERNKIVKIEKILIKLNSFDLQPEKGVTQIQEGLVLRASNSYYGEQFYFFIKETMCPFVKINYDNQEVDIHVTDPTNFRPARIGQTETYQQGRPGELFDVWLCALEIY